METAERRLFFILVVALLDLPSSVNSVALDGDCTSQACEDGLICENNVCMIGVGESCATPNEDKCQTGLICEDDTCSLCSDTVQCSGGLVCDTDEMCKQIIQGTCKLDMEGDCTSLTTAACKIGLECDANKCKQVLQGTCAASSNCKTGHVCDTDNTCKLDMEGDCTSLTTAACKIGLECDANKCKQILQGTCAASSNCKSGLVCDADDKCKLDVDGACTTQTSTNCKLGTVCVVDKCLIDVEGSCAGGNSSKCKTGLTCEANKCMIDVGGSCAGTNATKCKTGLKCEADKCRKQVGQDCSSEEECVQNADCSTTCKCKSGFTQQDGLCSDAHKTTGSLFILAAALLLKSRLG